MLVLIDTCVWIDHIRRDFGALHSLLRHDDVVMHEHVIGEVACGYMKQRREVLELLGLLPCVGTLASHEVLHFIEARSLAGRGLGLVDMHLLATCATHSDITLWTNDRRLNAEAEKLGVRRRLH